MMTLDEIVVIDTCYGNKAVIHDGRRYTFKIANKNGSVRWQCANFKTCSSTITTFEGRLIKCKDDHTCGPPDYEMVGKEIFMHRCRERARNETIPITRIIKQETAKFNLNIDYKSIKSSLYRHRHKRNEVRKSFPIDNVPHQPPTLNLSVNEHYAIADSPKNSQEPLDLHMVEPMTPVIVEQIFSHTEKRLQLPEEEPPRVPQTGGGGQVGQSPGGGSPGPASVPAVKKAVTAPPPAPAAPPEVCLRWNSYHSNMQATFPSLLNNEQFVDVTLACEGRSIKCHKVMLSACSSYFEELLSQNPCQHPIIFMRDLKFWEVQALVEFMYTGEVNVAQDKLPSLLTAAEALQIKGLTNPGGGGGGGSTGSYAASQEDDSNTTPDIDDVSSPSYCPPSKKIRKRKATNPTSYHQKAQAVYSPVTQQGSPISSPMLHQVAAPPALTPMRMMSQPNIGIPQIASHATSQSAPAAHSTSQPPAAHPGTQTATVQSRPSQPRIKKEPGSPPHSYLPPPHPPFTHVIKSEPDDNMDALLDLSESESRKESNAVQPPQEPLSLATNDQGPSSNGSQSKAQDNGLSEDDTGSDCSESQSMHIDPGETSDA